MSNIAILIKVLCCGIFKYYFINIIDGFTFCHLLLFFPDYVSVISTSKGIVFKCLLCIAICDWLKLFWYRSPLLRSFFLNIPLMKFPLQIHLGTLINLFCLFNVACLMKWILLLTFVCCCQMLATQFLTWARYDKNEFTSSWNPSVNQYLIRKGPTKT